MMSISSSGKKTHCRASNEATGYCLCGVGGAGGTCVGGACVWVRKNFYF